MTKFKSIAVPPMEETTYFLANFFLKQQIVCGFYFQTNETDTQQMKINTSF